MHDLNKDTQVLIFGNSEFVKSINEISNYLNFKLNKFENWSLINKDFIFLIESSFLKDKKNQSEIESFKNIKIIICKKNEKIQLHNNYIMELPLSINELNLVVKNQNIKNIFQENSSLMIKGYTLDKNEKKLIYQRKFIFLTEREILLLELLLESNSAVSKKDILKKVWNYAEGADTHTIETHIYRLRKKIKSKFEDENFIINTKIGYKI
tara:strand:+ start:332 stop:961 length:630 start_codon:yes stop_codon:yes gene_type:complete